mmetsp:Transcript_1863/g.4717  ORF Transcript_1863/g.4717 Transcript_1863/m.4717 type:complete len:272 (-) Transcript_1863:1620-2435(-)
MRCDAAGGSPGTGERRRSGRRPTSRRSSSSPSSPPPSAVRPRRATAPTTGPRDDDIIPDFSWCDLSLSDLLCSGRRCRRETPGQHGRSDHRGVFRSSLLRRRRTSKEARVDVDSGGRREHERCLKSRERSPAAAGGDGVEGERMMGIGIVVVEDQLHRRWTRGAAEVAASSAVMARGVGESSGWWLLMKSSSSGPAWMERGPAGCRAELPRRRLMAWPRLASQSGACPKRRTTLTLPWPGRWKLRLRSLFLSSSSRVLRSQFLGLRVSAST